MNLNVNSDLTVAYLNMATATKPLKYTIYDVYNPAFERGGQLRSTEVGFYNEQNKLLWINFGNKFFDRKNLTGIEFKSVIVVCSSYSAIVIKINKFFRILF